MLSAFETMAQKNPMRVCFAAVDAEGIDVPYGHQQTRLMAAAIAWRLQEFGAQKNTYVMVDLPNIAIYPLLVLAAAYGGFGLIPLDYRMAEREKEAQIADLRADLGEDLAFIVDKSNVLSLMRWAIDFLAGKHGTKTQEEGTLGANLTQRTVGGDKSSSNRSLSFRFSGGNQRNSNSMSNSAANRANQSRSAQEVCVHFAERQAHLFNPDSPAFIFPTQDALGRTRGVCHTWKSVLGNAQAANHALSVDRMSVWQCVLPLWTVEGMQVVLRCLAGNNSFVLYRSFNPEQVLREIRQYRVTHIALNTPQLSAFLKLDMPEFSQYLCVLVDCSHNVSGNEIRLFKAARRASSHVRLAYGTPETAGMLAVEDDLVQDTEGAGLVCAMRPLSGCQFVVAGADAQGFGSLAVKTSALCTGYLDGRALRMRNGYFITGDEGALYKECLYLR